MAKGIDIKRVCELAKLEIPEQNMTEISKKVEEVLIMFDKLDEFTIGGSEASNIDDLKLEIAFENLRDDNSRLDIGSPEEPKAKSTLKNIKDGFILGPRI